MSDEEQRRQFEDLNAAMTVVLKSLADQQILLIRVMAHQQAHLAALREILVRSGEDRTMLYQRLRGAYDTAVQKFQPQLAAFLKQGDAISFLTTTVFPDDTLGN